jgi:intein-encoded DNA endonuclease-like protein
MKSINCLDGNCGRMDTKNLSQKELGYLIGLYIGDGYSNYNKKDRHYRVDFYLNSIKDQDIMKNLIILLKRLCLNPFVFKDKRCNMNRIRVNSKKFMIFVEKMSKKFISLNKDYKMGLLSGFIDAEGYVTKGEIMVTQKNKYIINHFKKISESLNVFRKLWKSTNNKSGGYVWRLRISTKFKYLLHNSYKVNRIYSGVGQNVRNNIPEAWSAR